MDALASTAGAAMNRRDTDREQPEGAAATMDQSEIDTGRERKMAEKPLARSVEKKLKKLLDRIAKKEAEEKVAAFEIPSPPQGLPKRIHG